MSATARALTATRLLYPAHRTRLITERMQRSLAEQQERRITARWLLILYRGARFAGKTPAAARAWARNYINNPLPF
jgi:hypothetical protein